MESPFRIAALPVRRGGARGPGSAPALFRSGCDYYDRRQWEHRLLRRWGPGTGATLGLPNGVAVDSAGNVYIADSLNNRIRRVDTAGTITTVAGNGFPISSGDGGPATSAHLANPVGVAVDRAANIYIADTGNGRVRKVNPAGTINTMAGNGLFGSCRAGGGAATGAGIGSSQGVWRPTAPETSTSAILRAASTRWIRPGQSPA